MGELMRTHILVPRRLIEQVDREVGPRRRSEFVAQALEEKLARLRLRAVARDVAGSLADVDTPGWETSESAAAWVRSLREAADQERAVAAHDG